MVPSLSSDAIAGDAPGDGSVSLAFPASCSPFCQVEGWVPKPRLARVPSQ